MKRKFLLFIIVIFLLPILHNCDDSVTDNTKYTSVDSRINIRLREELSANKKQLILIVKPKEYTDV